MSNAPVGRRAQNRAARFEQMTAAATEIIAESGLNGLTMLAVSERVDCAVGTIYTYFHSKSSLIAELQIRAMRVLMDAAQTGREQWNVAIEEAGLDQQTAALVRLVASGHNLTAAPDLHPREFELLQLLISQPQRELTPEDTLKVVPATIAMLSQLYALISDAVEVGALRGEPSTEGDPHATDGPIARTLRWISALNGTMQLSNATADPKWLDDEALDGQKAAKSLANDLLLGWGADFDKLGAATAFVVDLDRKGELVYRGRSVAELDALEEIIDDTDKFMVGNSGMTEAAAALVAAGSA